MLKDIGSILSGAAFENFSQKTSYGRRKISGQGINILPEISGRFGQPRSDDAISRPTRHKFFLLYVRIESAAPGLGSGFSCHGL
jgi:hypothetical protein